MPPTPEADQLSLAPPTDVSVADRNAVEEPVAGTAVELCVRSLSEEVQPLLDETLDRLDAAEVEPVDVVVWGRSFDPTGTAATTDFGRSLADRIETFRRWETENDASFAPFFRARTVDRLTDETCTRVDLPTVTLAEYRDGELAFVAPCRLAGRHYTVLDRAERLADGEHRSATPVPVPEGVEPGRGNGAPVRT
jgi:hypothetical protein